MAAIDELVKSVEDENVRAGLESEVSHLRRRLPFGLVFEPHLPEVLPIPGARLRPGARIARRGHSTADTYKVVRISSDTVQALSEADGSEVNLDKDSVVVVKRHGESVFPCLSHVESVLNGDENTPFHSLIEAENHTALQLLRWLRPRSFDCIYIDPPYNTGAKVWKYNNNYVDSKDAFKSSKWLSMMEKRLHIARGLLKEDGVLVIAIDDYEYAHLMCLLRRNDLFPNHDIGTVAIQHNPRGAGGNNVSRTHEYAIFLVPPGRALEPISRGADELRDYRRRGQGDNNFRYGRENSFFALHVDPNTLDVVGIGPRLGADDPYETGPTPEGYLRVYPMLRNGTEERVWRNYWATAKQMVEDGLLKCTKNGTIVQVISGTNKKVPIKSLWASKRYNAGQSGTDLVSSITGVQFPYPKSIYTVLDCLRAAVGTRKDARILDFFAGSGTTLHATSLLNSIDGGNRRCILVTNNEVEEKLATQMEKDGLLPGDEAWESEGICRSITFPRCRNAILGKDSEGNELTFSIEDPVNTVIREKPPKVSVLPYLPKESVNLPASRKSLAGLLGITQSALGKDSPWYIASPDSKDTVPNQAVLLDTDHLESFVDALESEGGHIQRVHFVPPSAANAQTTRITKRLKAVLNPILVEEARRIPASDGFKENLAYFRMSFLDPDDVELGAKLSNLMPSLWMMAGSVGPVPTEAEGDAVFPEATNFGVLVNERAYRDFAARFREAPELEWAFIVCDSEEGFRQMSAGLPDSVPWDRQVHLYRDYIDNFRIHRGGQR